MIKARREAGLTHQNDVYRGIITFPKQSSGAQHEIRLVPDCATAHRSASHSGNSLSGWLCVWLAEPWGPSPTGTARLSARFRLLAPDSSRSQVEELSETSQDAARAHRFRSAFRLSLWRLSEFQLRTRIWVLLRRAVRGSISALIDAAAWKSPSAPIPWESRLTLNAFARKPS